MVSVAVAVAVEWQWQWQGGTDYVSIIVHPIPLLRCGTKQSPVCHPHPPI
jgi:hypothetical protein